MSVINLRAHRYWQSVFGFADLPEDDNVFTLHIADTLPSRHSLLKLVRHDHKTFVAATRRCAAHLSLKPDSRQSDIEQAMHEKDLIWYDEDAVHYFSDADQKALPSSPRSADIRQLTESDADAFERFRIRMPTADWDEVTPELDNEAVFGCFQFDELCSVADYYRWQQSPFADLGVITAPDCRQQGKGAQVVKALSGHACARGLIPQYRAQVTNQSSQKVARRLNMQRFGLWTVAVGSA